MVGFQGFGNPQITFAIESQMDMLAEKIGMDPAEIRIKNSKPTWRYYGIWSKITSCGLRECIEAAGRSIGLRKNRLRTSNRGLNCCGRSYWCRYSESQF